MDTSALIRRIVETPHSGRRRLVAVAGPPASGKSTFSEELAAGLPDACVVPMDGFHLDNRVLEARGLLARKGAPETFDVAGFVHLVRRLQTEAEVIFPVFDRSAEHAIAGAGVVSTATRTVIVEGNYLLLDAPGWKDLRVHWDVSVFLSVPEAELIDRLQARWLGFGFSPQQAQAKIEQNDLLNALTVINGLHAPDVTIEQA